MAARKEVGEKKQAARNECDDRGIGWREGETIKSMNDRCAEYDRKHGKAPQPRATAKTRTRAGSARSNVSRSGGGNGGSTRARSAPLTRAAPTTQMRVDMRDYDPQPMRRTTSADILAVALVVFLGALAYFGTPKHGPTSHTTVTIVAHA